MSNLQPAPEETAQTSLGKGRLGVSGIVFFVVAAAAPLVGMTGAVPVAIFLGNGAAVPGTYLMVGIILLSSSVGYATIEPLCNKRGCVLRIHRSWSWRCHWCWFSLRFADRLSRNSTGHFWFLRCRDGW